MTRQNVGNAHVIERVLQCRHEQHRHRCRARALFRLHAARAIADLVKRGVIAPKKGVRVRLHLFDLEDSTRRAMSHYRNLAQGRGGEIDIGKTAHQRAKLAAAQTRLVETKQKKLAGELVDAGEVENAWSGILRTVRAGVLAVPSRCAQRLPHLTPHDVGEIDQEVRSALTEIGSAS